MKLAQRTVSKLRRLIKRNQEPARTPFLLLPRPSTAAPRSSRLSSSASCALCRTRQREILRREVDVNLCVTGSIEVAATVGWVMKTNCPFPYYFLILRLPFRRPLPPSSAFLTPRQATGTGEQEIFVRRTLGRLPFTR